MSGEGIALLCSGRGVLVVGVEPDPGGLATRVYVNHRSDNRYFLISDPEARETVEQAWRSTKQHVVADIDQLQSLGPLLTISDS